MSHKLCCVAGGVIVPPPRGGGTHVVRQRDEVVNVGDRIEINCEVTGTGQT